MSSSDPRLVLNLARRWVDTEPVAVAQQALTAGFDGIGLVDSPRLFRDGWVETERVLTSTDAALAGPVVASLGLRHPTTVAGALRTLEQHHPGRAFTVVGRGESSVANEGITAPTLAEYRMAMRSLRELLRDERGHDRLAGRLLGAASGPRTVTATAAELGGVLLDVGVDQATVARAARLAREAEPTTAVWLFIRALVVDDPRSAAAAAAPLLGSCAMRMANAPDWFGLADDQVAAVRRLAEAHDYRRHGAQQHTATDTHGGEHPHDDRRDDSGVEDDDDVSRLVRRRFLLIDTAPAIADTVAGSASAGIDGIIVAGALPGVLDRLEALGSAMRAGLARRTPPDPTSTERGDLA